MVDRRVRGQVCGRRQGWWSRMVWALAGHVWDFAFILRVPGHLGGFRQEGEVIRCVL